MEASIKLRNLMRKLKYTLQTGKYTSKSISPQVGIDHSAHKLRVPTLMNTGFCEDVASAHKTRP